MAVTKDHILAFGSITHFYANAESFIKYTIAGLTKTKFEDVVVLTAPYQSAQLINVVKSLAKLRDIDDDSANSLLEIIGDFKARAKMRNFVAHSRWTDGKRPGSIKPTNADIRAVKLVLRGRRNSDEQDWTAEELQQEAALTQKLCFDIVAWMFAEGMLSDELIRMWMESSDNTPEN